MGIKVTILQDTSPESPRDWDNVGVMACWHNAYTLGDEQPSCTPEEWIADNAPEGSIVLPLYLYDHSGITMSTRGFSCPWDSGQVGVIVCTPDKIKVEWNGDREKATEYLQGEVAVYDSFLTGSVYGYNIEHTDDDCDHCGQAPEPTHVDSCFGFYGECLDAMKDHVEDEYHAALTEAWENL